MSILRDIALAGVVSSALYYAAATIAAARFARRGCLTSPSMPAETPAVAMLKPIHGAGFRLRENLASFLAVDYPRTSYVFGLDAADDPAASIVKSLIEPTLSGGKVEISASQEPDASNRKVAKLIAMANRLSRADSDVIVLSDADVSVERDYLKKLIGELYADEKTGVVTCLYRARPQGGLASRLEAAFINTDFVPMAIFSAAIEPLRHAFGATIAIKHEVLDAIDGFKPIKDLLADDFFIGKLAADKGYEVKLSTQLVTINCEENRLHDFWTHQLRWARTYRHVRPTSPLTIVIHGPFWALVLLLTSGFSAAAWFVLFTLLCGRLAMSTFLLRRVLGLAELSSDIWLIPFKDLLMTALWFASLCGRDVVWGGRRFRMAADGRMEEVRV